MLKIVMGDVGSGKSTYVTEKIKEDIANGKSAFLIVPEQQTVERERTMADELPPSAPLTFEVTNFSRLANTVFRALGGLCYNYADKTVRMLIMWRTLTDLSPMLHEFSEPDARKINRAVAAVNELRFSKITPFMLENAAKRVEGEALKNRLLDLALITTTYTQLEHIEYEDVADDLDRLCDLLDAKPFFAGKSIYIDEFVSFTEQQYSVIERLLKTSDVTVCVYEDFTEKKLCFGESRQLLERLAKMAERQGVSVETVRLCENRRTKSHLIRYTADKIWSQDFHSSRFDGESDGSLTVACAPDVYAEADYVASLCVSLAREGARYSDIAVIADKSESYHGILDEAFERCNVPYFMSHKEDITSLELLRYIQSAYEVIAHGFRLEDVITYIKCGLCGVSDDEVDRFELYAHRWSINGRRAYLDKDSWKMNPRGYVDNESDSDRELLIKINETRKKAFAPLSGLCESCEGVHTVFEHSRALMEFLLSQNMESVLVNRSRELLSRGDSVRAEYYARLWEIICDCLDTLTKTVGDAEVRADKYSELLRMMFSSVDIGRIPSSSDEVTVGDADTLRIGTKKHIILIGVNDGVFPAAVKDNGLFGDADRKALAALGINIGSERELEAERKLFGFMRSMLLCSDTLTVCYHTQNAQLEASRPSIAVSRIRSIANGRERFVDIRTLSPEFFVCSRDGAVRTLSRLGKTAEGKALRGALATVDGYSDLCCEHTPVADGECAISVTPEAFGSTLYLSQSKIDKFIKCPFLYYCKYVLKLSDNSKSEFNVASIGNFLHACFEEMFRVLDADGREIGSLADEELSDCVSRATESYIARVCPPEKRSSARLSHLFSRLERTAQLVARNMRDEFAKTAFKPKLFEAKISGDGDIPPVKFTLSDGTLLTVGGVADRIDTLELDGKTYIRIVDYKTGEHKFSLDGIRKGAEIQMLLYLFSAVKNGSHLFSGESVAAGVSYMMVNTSPVKVDKMPDSVTEAAMQKYTRSGVIIDDDCVVNALGADGGKEYLTTLVSRERLGEAFSELEQALCEIGERIRSGDASVPSQAHLAKERSCTYCEMKDVCRSRVES
ncbi:MAG: PD-(D/E)XK nuclease family protein [Clostridia bacterium]|nr:PD-(D/E)XK nuclease family protein [Clostridia bacterium]